MTGSHVRAALGNASRDDHQHPELSCLVFSGHDEIDYVRRALAAGAKGIVKGDPLALLAAVERVLAGRFISARNCEGGCITEVMSK
jgi:DNA-binding NarL/FixJ family response regulator